MMVRAVSALTNRRGIGDARQLLREFRFVQQLFDFRQIARQRNRTSAAVTGEAGFLHRTVEAGLIDRLNDIQRPFTRIALLGVLDQALATRLAQLYPDCLVVQLDCAKARLRHSRPAILFDLNNLPLRPASFDLVLINMLAHWVEDLPGLLVQIRKALQPDGLMLSACFAQGSLDQLAHALLGAESRLYGGGSLRCIPLPSMRQLTDLLVRAGFVIPVGDVQSIEVRWQSFTGMLRELRLMGEGNASQARVRHLTGGRLFQLAEALMQAEAGGDGCIKADVQIAWLHGWAPTAVVASDGATSV
ncbi:MAG: methyltransferase domain-containing protein [Pseudomonadota bacterium]